MRGFEHGRSKLLGRPRCNCGCVVMKVWLHFAFCYFVFVVACFLGSVCGGSSSGRPSCLATEVQIMFAVCQGRLMALCFCCCVVVIACHLGSVCGGSSSVVKFNWRAECNQDSVCQC